MDNFENKSLKNFNTFGINANAEKLIRIESEAQLISVLERSSDSKINILGGGSNILLTGDLEGLTLKNEIKGIEILSENEKEVSVVVGGGENWHQFVLWAIENDLGGIENLSLIPGTVGAAPIQNIGAYGVELKDVFKGLEAIDLNTHKRLIFSKKEAQFGYRDSIFKRDLKGKIFITKVILKLTKKHKIHIEYGAIRQVLSDQKIENPTIRDVSNAVIFIRKSKLPDPAEIGNAGSFFKNPVIDIPHFEKLKIEYPNIVSYPVSETKIKVPAGWLIDRAGWKGKRFGETGCHAKQALVLVNFDNAKGSEIWDLAQRILNDIKEKFGIELTPEVNVW